MPTKRGTATFGATVVFEAVVTTTVVAAFVLSL